MEAHLVIDENFYYLQKTKHFKKYLTAYNYDFRNKKLQMY